jgi:hypothetical protein
MSNLYLNVSKNTITMDLIYLFLSNYRCRDKLTHISNLFSKHHRIYYIDKNKYCSCVQLSNYIKCLLDGKIPKEESKNIIMCFLTKIISEIKYDNMYIPIDIIFIRCLNSIFYKNL